MEQHPGIIFVRISEITIPPEMQIPMKVPLRFILDLYTKKSCPPVLLSREKSLVEGIQQIKVAKLFGWTKIPAKIQDSEKLP